MMIVRNEVVEPSTLSTADQEALISSLYSVHCEIFDGVSRDQFAQYVVRSTAKKTRIQLSYGENGEIAGYLAMHAFRPQLRGEECTVLRAEAGLRRAYRGNASTAGFALSNILKTHWEYSGPLFYLGCLVHPSSYTLMANHVPTVWPGQGVDIPDDILDLMMRLGEEFHLDIVDPSRPLVRHVGWITRDTEAERRYWQTCDFPVARFYLEQNPGYVQGHGLLTLIPLGMREAAKTVWSSGTSRLRKTIQRTVGSMERKVLRRKLDAQTAEELLETVEEITGLDLDAVREQGLLGTRYPLASRQTLFRAGDKADAMYVVLEGSLFVMGEDADGEYVIDQLGPNTLVGEMAMMTGQTRAATVRAAIDSVLLRLTRAELDKLFSAEPRLETALWDRIHGRVFGLLARRHPEWSASSREQLEQWFVTAASHTLDENTSMDIPAGSTLILSAGELVEGGEGQSEPLVAPALRTIAGNVMVRAQTKAHFALLAEEAIHQTKV